MLETPIFIVGCDRSGTTLLRQMLTQSPVLHIPEESRFIAVLGKKAEDYGDFTKPYQRWFFIRDLQTNQATSKTFTFPIFNLNIEEVELILAKNAPMNFFDAVAEIYLASAKKVNKQRWGDKTPHQIKDILFLAKGFPNAKFIHIIRDGRDVAISIRKAGWLNRDLTKIANYWLDRVQSGRAAKSSLNENQYYEVRYEQLLIYPQKTLKELCSWLNLDYTDKMLDFYQNTNAKIPQEHADLFKLNKKPLEPSRAYAWKHTLSDEEIDEFESVAGELLKQLGYDVRKIKIFHNSNSHHIR